MSSNYQPVVDQGLREFAEKLKAPKEFYEEGLQLVKNVLETIKTSFSKKNSPFRVAKVIWGGSVGKKTDVISPDFDIALVMVDSLPPFKSILSDIDTILELNSEDLKISSDTIRSTKFSVQFSFTNSVKVDLLPVADISPAQIYSKIRDNPKNSDWYSGSLVESAVDFMKDQSTFAHSLARLTKFWKKSCYFGTEYIDGSSTMMELLAVASALQEEKHQDRSELRAFTRVIDWIQKIDILQIAFIKTNGAWEVTKLEGLNAGSPPERRSNLRDTVYLIEPANPYNNLLAGQKASVIEKFKTFAGVTRDRLDLLMKGSFSHLSAAGVHVLELEKIFQVQPTILKQELPNGTPLKVCASILESYPSIHCDKKVRRDVVLKRREVAEFINAMQQYLLWTVHTAARGTTHNEVRTTVYNGTKKMIETNLQVKLVPATDNHKSHDVTLTVPCGFYKDRPAVRVSFSW